SASASAPVVAAAPGECAALAPARQLSFTGAMTLSFAEGAAAAGPPMAIFNLDGAARTAQLAPKAQKGADAGVEFAAENATPPGCAIAGGQAFCMSKSGNVLRSRVTGEDAKVIAAARAGSSLAAAAIGEHTVLV